MSPGRCPQPGPPPPPTRPRPRAPPAAAAPPGALGFLQPSCPISLSPGSRAGSAPAAPAPQPPRPSPPPRRAPSPPRRTCRAAGAGTACHPGGPATKAVAAAAAAASRPRPRRRQAAPEPREGPRHLGPPGRRPRALTERPGRGPGPRGADAEGSGPAVTAPSPPPLRLPERAAPREGAGRTRGGRRRVRPGAEGVGRRGGGARLMSAGLGGAGGRRPPRLRTLLPARFPVGRLVTSLPPSSRPSSRLRTGLRRGARRPLGSPLPGGRQLPSAACALGGPEAGRARIYALTGVTWARGARCPWAFTSGLHLLGCAQPRGTRHEEQTSKGVSGAGEGSASPGSWQPPSGTSSTRGGSFLVGVVVTWYSPSVASLGGVTVYKDLLQNVQRTWTMSRQALKPFSFQEKDSGFGFLWGSR